eukprot:4466289-Amphidinium_carterae.4
MFPAQTHVGYPEKGVKEKRGRPHFLLEGQTTVALHTLQELECMPKLTMHSHFAQMKSPQLCAHVTSAHTRKPPIGPSCFSSLFAVEVSSSSDFAEKYSCCANSSGKRPAAELSTSQHSLRPRVPTPQVATQVSQAGPSRPCARGSLAPSRPSAQRARRWGSLHLKYYVGHSPGEQHELLSRLEQNSSR